MKKILRITTVPISLKVLLKGQLRFMSERFEVVGVSSEGGGLNDVAVTEGVRTVGINMSRKITPLEDLISLWELYKLFKKEKPQIVHSHTPKAGILGMLAAKLAGVPIRLHTVAGMPLMEATGTKRKILDFVEKLTYSCATKVYPNSKGLYDFILENNYTSKSKVAIIANGSSNGINTDYFSPNSISEASKTDLRESVGINTGEFVFVFVGRLVGDKGINELISAFKYISRECDGKDKPVIKLLLVGSFESDLDPLLPSTLEEIDSNENIISVGFQTDVRPYFAISNCLVFPSYREGFPNVVMQAGAMGLPSIVSNINGCNEIISEGENGMIIPVKNSEALRKSMEVICENREYYLSLQYNARNMITSRFEQEVIWKAILLEYEEQLKLKGLN